MSSIRSFNAFLGALFSLLVLMVVSCSSSRRSYIEQPKSLKCLALENPQIASHAYARLQSGYLKNYGKPVLDRYMKIEALLKDEQGFTKYIGDAFSYIGPLKRILKLDHSVAAMGVFEGLGFDLHTLLPKVLEEDDVEAMKHLVEAGVDVRVRAPSGKTLLHLAAEQGRLKMVKWLVEKACLSVRVTDASRNTPLHLAAANKHLEIMQYLVQQARAKVDAVDSFDKTPLYKLIERYDDPKYVEDLVNLGADLHVVDCWNKTLLHLALEKRHLKTLHYLAAANPNVHKLNTVIGSSYKALLHIATKKKYPLEIMECLVKIDGINLEVRNLLLKTPLHLAVAKGRMDIVACLVQTGLVDLNVRDRSGRTPLHIAAEKGHLNIIKYLVEIDGVELNPRDNVGRIPLHLAARRGHLEAVKFLVKAGAAIAAKDNANRTPLGAARDGLHPEIVFFLRRARLGSLWCI